MGLLKATHIPQVQHPISNNEQYCSLLFIRPIQGIDCINTEHLVPKLFNHVSSNVTFKIGVNPVLVAIHSLSVSN